MTLSFPPILYAPLYALCVFWVAAAMGVKLLRLLRVSDTALNPWERGALAAALGVGLLQFLPYGLGLFGVLYPRNLRLALILLAVLLAPEMLRIAKRGWKHARAAYSSRLPLSLRAWFALLFLYCGIACLGAFRLGSVGDDDGYHLTAPRRWLEVGSLAYLPTYSHTNSPMGFEMLYACALATCGTSGAKMTHIAAGFACLCTLALVAGRLGSGFAGLTAVSLWLLPLPLNVAPFLFALAYNDYGVCWMVAASALAWLVWRERRETPLLVVAMLCAGFAGSFKFTALSLSVALLIVTVWECARNTVSWREIRRLVGLAGCVALLPVLPWLGRNLAVTQNPVYPLLSGIFPTRDWSPEQARVFGLFFKYYNWGVASGSAMSLTQRKEIVLCGILAVVLALVVCLRFDKDARTRQMNFIIALLLVAALFTTGAVSRFWMPAVMLACAVAGAWAARRPPVAQWGAWPATLLLVVGLMLYARYNRAYWRTDLRLATGRLSPVEQHKDDAFWKTWAYINAHTPRQSHVLLAAFYPTFGMSSGGAFLCNRDCYVTDSHLQDCIHLGDWTSFLRSLDECKIAYIVIADGQFNSNRQGFAYPAGRNEYVFCRRLADQSGEKVAQFDHLQIYLLRRVSTQSEH